MREKLGPVLLLAEVHHAIRLHAHGETGPDRYVACECFLPCRARSLVFFTSGENDEGDRTGQERPVTLHDIHMRERTSRDGRANEGLTISVITKRYPL